MEASIDHTSSNETGTEERSSNGLTVREAEQQDFPMILMCAEVMWRESVYSTWTLTKRSCGLGFMNIQAGQTDGSFFWSTMACRSEGCLRRLVRRSLGTIWSLMKRHVSYFQRRVDRAVFLFCLAALESWAIHESAKTLVFDANEPGEYPTN